MLRLWLVVLLSAALGACTHIRTSSNAAAGAASRPAIQAWQALQAEFEGDLQQLAHPPPDSTTAALAYPYSANYRLREQNLHNEALTRAQNINVDALDDDAREQWELFVLARREALARLLFPQYRLALDPIPDPVAQFTAQASGHGTQRFSVMADYQHWAQTARGFPALVDQLIANLGQGIASSITEPQIRVAHLITELDAVISDDPRDTPLWQPIAQMPASIARADQEQLVADYEILVADRLIPAYQKLRDYLHDTYEAAARSTPGMAALPNGAQWYTTLLRQATSTTLHASELHRIATRQIAHLHAQGVYACGNGALIDPRNDSGQAYRQGLALYRANDAAQELRAAAALALDTGIHAHRWSTEQAAQFWRSTCQSSATEALQMVMQVSADPARASAAAVGLLKLRELHATAQAQLGSSFDARAFEAALPQNQQSTLSIITRRFSRWLAARG